MWGSLTRSGGGPHVGARASSRSSFLGDAAGRRGLGTACNLSPRRICHYVTNGYIMGMNGARAPPTLSTLRHSNYISVHVGLSNIRLVTNNPRKIVGIEGYGLEVVERVPIEITPQDSNVHYLRTKKTKLGHLLKTGLAVP